MTLDPKALLRDAEYHLAGADAGICKVPREFLSRITAYLASAKPAGEVGELIKRLRSHADGWLAPYRGAPREQWQHEDEDVNECAMARDCDRAAIALEALSRQGSAEVVAVKPLEWVKRNPLDTMTRADSIIGPYRVWTHHEAKGSWFWQLENHGSIPANSEADGHAAAQADYEARIRSALVAAPPAQPAEVERAFRLGWGEGSDWSANGGVTEPWEAETAAWERFSTALASVSPAAQNGGAESGPNLTFQQEPLALTGGADDVEPRP